MCIIRARLNALTMRTLTRAATLACVFLLSSGIAAQERQSADLAETLVAQGRLEDGIVACSACHRNAGEGDAGSGFANLTGLSKEYFAKQLEDFQSGARENRVMQVVTKNLTAADIAALALYYSSLKPQAAVTKIPETPAVGVVLAEKGDADRNIPACNECHAGDGKASNNKIPRLYGQHPVYLTNQLADWQSGLRRNDPGSVMMEISKKLTPAEIGAVAIYFARLSRSAH